MQPSLDEIGSLGIAQLVVSLLAAVFCASTITIILATKLYKVFVHRLTLYLSAACLALFITYGASTLTINVTRNDSRSPEGGRFCEAMGAFVVYSRLSCLVAVVWITAYVAKTTWCGSTRRYYQSTRRLREGFSVLAVAIVPALFFWLPYTQDTYGLYGVGCGIRIDYLNKSDWRLIFDASVAAVSTASTLVLAAILFLFCSAACSSSHVSAQSRYRKVSAQVLHLTLYPLVFSLHLIATLMIDIAYYSGDTAVDYTLLITANSSATYALSILLPTGLFIREDVRIRVIHQCCGKSIHYDELSGIASTNKDKEDATLLGIHF